MKNRQTIIPGRIIKCPAGYAAYVPNPLPPRIDWRPSLLHALSEADLLLGKLAGEGRRLPNPHMLIRPFVRREASLQPHRRNANWSCSLPRGHRPEPTICARWPTTSLP